MSKLKSKFKIGDKVINLLDGSKFTIRYIDDFGFEDEELNKKYPFVFCSDGNVRLKDGGMTCINEDYLKLIN